MFASKTPAEPRRVYLQCRHGDFPQDDGLDSCVTCRAVWEEYPHVQHNEPNPILVEFRKYATLIDWTWGEAAEAFLFHTRVNGWPSVYHHEIEHARKVLGRLVAAEVSS